MVIKKKVFHWQFRVLPFGLATIPRIFTKVLAESVAFLHLQGIVLIPYLDNLLIFAPLEAVQVKIDTKRIVMVLQSWAGY